MKCCRLWPATASLPSPSATGRPMRKGFNDFSIRDLVTQPGSESWVNKDQGVATVPSRHRWSEAWALIHGNHAFGVFSFNQENMLFSVISTIADGKSASLRFGGAVMLQGEPAALTPDRARRKRRSGHDPFPDRRRRLPRGDVCLSQDARRKGLPFPKDFNPPVHWEQLYDMPDAWNDRPRLYTKAIIEREAAKGRDYHCEALYLDPGWDTDFGQFSLGRKVARSAKTVHRRNAVEIRAEGVAAHAAGDLDVACRHRLGAQRRAELSARSLA